MGRSEAEIQRRREYARAYYQKHRALRNERTRRYYAQQTLSTPTMRPALRLRALSEFKLKAGCADCGYNAHPAALHFDHLPGTQKLGNIAAMVRGGYADEDVLAEIKKCEVVCANCHAIRGAKRVEARFEEDNHHAPRASSSGLAG